MGEEAEEEEEEMMMNLGSTQQFVAPELQILTPSYMVGYLNGVSSLIKSGISDHCDSGLSLGIETWDLLDGNWRRVCPAGRLEWTGERGVIDAVLDELDVLLTGGRLSPVAKLAVRTAYMQ